MKKLLPLLNALFFLLVTTGQSAVNSLPEDKITTQLGDLQVIYEGKNHYVEWNGKIIYKMPPEYRSLSFVKHFTNVKSAEIILINEHEGGSGCAGRYRLIVLRQGGSYEVTKALGNCTEARVKEQGPNIILYFPAFINAPSQTWTYEKFRLRKTAERKSRAPGFWMFSREEHENFIKFIIWDKAREDNESYEVWFVVTSPAGKQYKAKKKISGSYTGDVIFPDSFNIRLDELEPGLYLCKYLVNEETLAECRFYYDNPKGTKGFKVVDLLSEGDLWEERSQELKKE